jgi:hypothetical protein
MPTSEGARNAERSSQRSGLPIEIARRHIGQLSVVARDYGPESFRER